jgi:hypothetical protein
MELKDSRRDLRSLNEEAVAGDRGVLGGFAGSISSFGNPTDATVVDVLKWRGVLPGVSRAVPRQVGVLRRSRQPNDVDGQQTDIHGSEVGGESPYEKLD